MRPALLVSALSFLLLSSCVAAIGNSGLGSRQYPAAAAPLLQERVTAATRIVELRQRRLDSLRDKGAASAVDTATLIDAEIQLEEAKLRLLECRAELMAVEKKKD